MRGLTAKNSDQRGKSVSVGSVLHRGNTTVESSFRDREFSREHEMSESLRGVRRTTESKVLRNDPKQKK